MSQSEKTVVAHIEEKLEGYIGSVLIVGFTAIILYNIIARSFAGSQIDGGIEITLGAFTWLSWIAASFAIRHDSHLRFTLFRRTFSSRQNYALYVIEWGLWVILSGCILYFAIPVLQDRIVANNTIVGTDIPKFLMYAAIPVAMVFILVRTGQQAVRVTKAYRNEEDITPSATIGIQEDE